MSDQRGAFTFQEGSGSVVAVAIHAGHDLRADVQELVTLDDATRLREEDPYTDRLTAVAGTRVVSHRSRFEVDLNRPRNGAVYREPKHAWGLEVWREPLPPAVAQRSLEVYDAFYAALADVLDRLQARGPFVVLDLHSYNHRRESPTAPPAPQADNPEVNVGTGSLPRDQWGPVVDRFIEDLAGARVRGRRLDVRENVRFRGGHLSQWVHQHYADRGCALAIELKKTFMDEWTGDVDDDHLGQLASALRSTIPGLAETAVGASR